MATITIEVPDALAARAAELREQLPELLARSLEQPALPTSQIDPDLQQIVAVLASQPTPQQVLAIQPSPQIQQRVSDLLLQNKTFPLGPAERAELDRYLFLDHLVRMAKAYALQQLAHAA